MAEDKTAKETLPADLARVPAKSLALFSVRSADVWSSSLAKGLRAKLDKGYLDKLKEVEKKTGLAPEDIERTTVVIKDSPDAMPLFFFGTTKAFDRARVFSLAVPEGREEKYSGETIFANEMQAAYVLGERAFVIGTKGDIQSVIDSGKDKPTGGLLPALVLAAKKHAVVVAVNPTMLSLEEDKLPAEAEPFKPLFKATSATLTLDLGEKLTGNVRVAFPGTEEADGGVKAVEAGRRLAATLLGRGIKELSKDETLKALAGILQIASKSLNAATIKRDGSFVVGHLEMQIDQATAGAVVVETMARMRGLSARDRSVNNLKQIGIAMHNYHAATGALPAQAVYDKDGKAS